MKSISIEDRSTDAGARLCISVPVGLVDEKALRTLSADMPDFLIPFTYMRTDHSVELSYTPGSFGKLKYFLMKFPGAEYAALWKSILEPAIQCSDWFADSGSLVYDTEYVYYNPAGKNVRFIYIPIKTPDNDSNNPDKFYKDLLSKLDTDDIELKLKLTVSALGGLNAGEIINALKGYSREVPKAAENAVFIAPQASVPIAPSGTELFVKTDKKLIREDKKNRKLFAQQLKAENKQKKRTKESDVFLGAAAAPAMAAAEAKSFAQMSEETEIIKSGTEDVCFRSISNLDIPKSIIVPIEIGKSFSIGRFDSGINTSQSDFEFDGSTKAVSRRHAVIERGPDGYYLIDIGSRAGTFINSVKVMPNALNKLKRGDRVSFGNAGADYEWNGI